MLNIPQEIGDLLKTDGVLKNFRVSFPNGECTDISNDRLLMESVQFTESINSRSPIKFGLCESSVLRFTCIGDRGDDFFVCGEYQNAVEVIDGNVFIITGINYYRITWEDEQAQYEVLVDDGSGLKYTGQTYMGRTVIYMESLYRYFNPNIPSLLQETQVQGMVSICDVDMPVYVYSVINRKAYKVVEFDEGRLTDIFADSVPATGIKLPEYTWMEDGHKYVRNYRPIPNIKDALITAQLEVDLSLLEKDKQKYACAESSTVVEIVDNKIFIITSINTADMVYWDNFQRNIPMHDGSGSEVIYGTLGGQQYASLHWMYRYFEQSTPSLLRKTATATTIDLYTTSMPIYLYSAIEKRAYAVTNVGTAGLSNELCEFDFTPTAVVGITLPNYVWSNGYEKYIRGMSVPVSRSGDVPFDFYPVPYGYFVVDSCKRDAQMLMREVVAYSLTDLQISPAYGYNNKRWNTYGSNSETLTFNVYNFLSVLYDIFPKSWYTIGSRKTVTDNTGTTGYKAYIERKWQRENRHLPEYFDERVTMRIDLYNYKAALTSGTSPLSYANVHYVAPHPDYSAIMETIRGIISMITHEYDEDHPNGFTFPPHMADDLLNTIWTVANSVWNGPFSEAAYNIETSRKFYNAPWDAFVNDEEWYAIAEMNFVINGESTHQHYEQRIYFLTSTSQYNVYLVTKNNDLPDINMTVAGTLRGDKYYFTDFFGSLDIKSMLESYMELAGVFGGMDRYGRFKIYDILDPLLLPSSNLYPRNDLYPVGSGSNEDTWAVTIDRNLFMSAWYEESMVQFYRVFCKFKNTDNQTDLYEEIINMDSTLPSYDVSSNIIISKGKYTSVQIAALIAPLVQNIPKLQYYQSDVNFKGLPYIEAGDYLYVETGDKRIATPVLKRDLTGIQDLRDRATSL